MKSDKVTRRGPIQVTRSPKFGEMAENTPDRVEVFRDEEGNYNTTAGEVYRVEGDRLFHLPGAKWPSGGSEFIEFDNLTTGEHEGAGTMVNATIKYYRNTIAEFGHNDINEGVSREAVADEWSETFVEWAEQELSEMPSSERTDLEMSGNDWMQIRRCEMREQFIDGLEEVQG